MARDQYRQQPFDDLKLIVISDRIKDEEYTISPPF